MRVMTFNANGIRSAANKGFFRWMVGQDADIVCLQETKAQEYQLPVTVVCPPGYHAYFFDAQRPGYSGVALYSRREPDAVKRGIGHAEFDAEGRYIQADFEGLSVASVYLPSGSSGPERQAVKYAFMDYFYGFLQELLRSGRACVLSGDWNIAHRAIDLKNWRGNQKNSGFLPEERAWLDAVFDTLGWVDAFRIVNQEAEQYTWWSNRGRAREKNVGWRIDYQVVTPDLAERVRAAAIYTAQRLSDHAPLTLEYAYEL